jgi:hypothetical protein
MDSVPTLQDFVLNLIYDPAARSAFDLDPQGVLHDAGLGDVTAADVQEVIPLVVDYAPLPDVAGVVGTTGVQAVATGVADADVTAGVAQLQAITTQLAVGAHPATDLTVATAGAFMVSTDNLLPGTPLVGAGVEYAGTVDNHSVLSVVHDPGLTLDAGVATATSVAATATAGANGLVASTGADGLVASTGVNPGATLDGAAHVATDVTSSIGLHHVVGLDGTDLHPAVSSVVGSVTGADPLGGVTSDHAHGVLDATGGVTSTATGLVSGLGHHAEPDAGHHLLGAVGDLPF